VPPELMTDRAAVSPPAIDADSASYDQIIVWLHSYATTLAGEAAILSLDRRTLREVCAQKTPR
jgi:hypothetical protein